jgi:hypothetical protein
MYLPKKLKWDTLGAFKKFLETETTEKVVIYNGYEIITETTRYGLCDSQLSYSPLEIIRKSMNEHLVQETNRTDKSTKPRTSRKNVKNKNQ